MTAPAGYRAAVVTLWVDDYSAESEIHGYVPDPPRFWNGWEVPIFPADTFVKERAAWQRLFPETDDESQTVTFPIVGDLSVVFHYEDDDDSEDLVDRFVIDGVEYVGAGAYVLVWEEVHHD